MLKHVYTCWGVLYIFLQRTFTKTVTEQLQNTNYKTAALTNNMSLQMNRNVVFLLKGLAQLTLTKYNQIKVYI